MPTRQHPVLVPGVTSLYLGPGKAYFGSKWCYLMRDDVDVDLVDFDNDILDFVVAAPALLVMKKLAEKEVVVAKLNYPVVPLVPRRGN